MWILKDCFGAPQCGCERREFSSFDDLLYYIEGSEEIMERLENGYATIEEETDR